jgi:hypothetical protein
MVGKVQREIVYVEPDAIVVYDRVTTTASQSQVWSLAFPAQPTISGTQTQVQASGHMLTIERVTPSSGPNASVHDYTADSDFSGGFRLDEQMPGGDQRWLHVIWIDGAVTNLSAHDDHTVNFMAGGKAVTVSFDPNAIGGTLTIGSSTTQLGAGVDELPE